ncbi:MAG: hypothetical protein QOG15_186 [Solirubrobacteraceae bacterium]|nr:hypothetical protein [Solirubrobacteraceae bacterium]
MSVPDDDRTEELTELARYTRQRRDLYRARSYSGRPSSDTRMRELEREAAQAQDRLQAFLAERERQVPGDG